MKKAKLWALLIVLVLSLGLLSGCSQSEMGLINLMSEMNDMEVYESQETVDFEISGSAFANNDPVAEAFIQAMLSTYSLKSNMRVDTDQQVFDGTFSLADAKSGTEKQIFSFVASGDTVYIKVDDFVAFAKTFGNEQFDKKLAVIGDAQYVSINTKEMARIMDPTGQVNNFNILNMKKQQTVYQNLMDGLSQEVFDEYETGMVKQNSKNKFTLKIDKPSVLNNIKPFMVYSINNAENINSFTKTFLGGLDAEELALLSMTPQTRTTAINEMTKMTDGLIANRSLYLGQVDAIASSAKEGSAIVGDKTGLTLMVEKQGDQNFSQSADMDISIADPDNLANNLHMAMKSTAQVKGIKTFSVTVPTSGIISWTDLEKRMPRVLKIDTAKQQYVLDQGLIFSSGAMDVHIVKGRTYLPVRTIGEAMNETVGWNSKIKQAYIVKNGKTINLAGDIFNSRAFIKIRDFEKLGYTVTWDKATKTAVLSQ